MTSDNMEPQVVVAPTGATCPVDDATSQRSFLQVEFLTDIVKKESVVRVLAPDAPTGARPAVDVCCVIDISGSMDDRAMVKNESGDKEYHGLNLLDVVKHATRAVTAMLNDNDRMAVVLFTTDARVLLPLTAATKENRERLFAELDMVDPENSTNLWGGLELAMNMLRDRSAVDACRRTGHVLLLTDGQPNVEPPRGHIPTLKRYIEALPNGVAPFMVHTFGFGYSIDTPLLRSIAELMGGLYVFIPDSGLVGTVFVNTASNILCTAATGLTIAVDLGSGRSIVTEQSDPLLVGGQQGVSSSIAHVTLGSVQFGQPRSVYLKWSEDSGKKVESGSGVARVQFTQGGTSSSVVAEEAAVAAGDATRFLQLATERSRAEYLHVMDKLYKLGMEQNMEPAKELLRVCIGRLTNVGSGSPLVAAFIQDLQGEVTATLEATAWTKWGRHYIPSLLRANAVQQCNNFKDHSVQLYGGTYFGVLRDEGEKSFLSVPAPVPKVNRTVRPASGARGLYGNVQAAHNGVAAAAAPAAAAPRANMRAYYNRSGGCITPESLVQLHDGAWIAAATVSKGMCLANGATVRCVVRIPVTQQTPMVQLDEHLCITEYHPVRAAGGTWQFPVDCLGGRRVLRDDVSEVYTYILEGGAAVPAAGNVEVVALGHGLTDNDVVRHEYLGTQRVVEDLMQLEGFHSVGMVTVGAFFRNPISQRIEGMERGVLIPAVSA